MSIESLNPMRKLKSRSQVIKDLIRQGETIATKTLHFSLFHLKKKLKSWHCPPQGDSKLNKVETTSRPPRRSDDRTCRITLKFEAFSV